MCQALIPPFDTRGNLPPGVHVAQWEEIHDKFGGNEWRRDLLDKVEGVARDRDGYPKGIIELDLESLP